MATLSAFASVGVILVVTGLFGVMAYTVSRNTREIGLRMALGAQADDVLRLMLVKALRLLIAGIVMGIMASYTRNRWLAVQITDVTTTDPSTVTMVVLIMLVVGLAACLLPARRATKVDPLVALRCE